MPVKKHIATVTVGSDYPGSIEFNSIPQTFTDLLIVLSVKSTGSNGAEMAVGVNGTIGNMTTRFIKGDGSSSISQAFGGQSDILLESNSSTPFGLVQIYIPNYTSTSTQKIIISEGFSEGDSTCFQLLSATINASNAAVTSVLFRPVYTAYFQQYSSMSIFGISNSGATGATVA